MKSNVILACLLASSCGPNNVPFSKTHDYESEGKRLYITSGKGGGYCVYTHLHNGEIELITTQGALSADQLGASLGYMSYVMQAVSSALPTVTLGYFSVSTRVAGEIRRVPIRAILLIGVAHLLNGMYRLIKGSYEGEQVGAIAAQYFFGWMPVNFFVEDRQRRGRLEKIADEHVLVKISERKINRIIEKISQKTSTWPDACQQALSNVSSPTPFSEKL